MNTTQQSPQCLPEFTTGITYAPQPLHSLKLPGFLFNEDSYSVTLQSFLPLPIIATIFKGELVILDGCKRFLAARQNGLADYWCGIIASPSDSAEFARARIRLNNHRMFTTTEKHLFTRELFGNTDQSTYLAACRDLAIDKNDIGAYERLINCSSNVCAAFLKGALDLHAAHDVEQLDVDDATAMIGLFSALSFSRQMQKEMVEWLPELAFREKTSAAALINAPWISDIIKNDKLNAPQKIDKLRQSIYERRFPTICRAKKTWNERATKLNPDPQNVFFKAADAFEKNRLELKITISSAHQAQTIFNHLAVLPEIAWDQLIYPAHLYGKE